jgi:hypothetical protein
MRDERIVGESQMTYDEADLKARLSKLSTHKRAVFAATCAERLVNSFNGDSNALRRELHSALNELWTYVIEGRANRDLVAMGNSLERLVDNDDRFVDPQPASSSVENAIAAVVYALRSCFDHPAVAVWAARQVIDAIDFRASATLEGTAYDAEVERTIANDPRLQAEIRRQQTVLQRLEDLKDEVSRDDVRAIRDGVRWTAPLFA